MLQQYQDRERELQCPFEPAHLIRHYRLAQHIRKCFKSHPEKKKIRCPFDATHIIDPATFAHHMEHCESSGIVWNSIYTVEPEKAVGNVPIEEACANQPQFLDEDWEGGHTTYDPIKHTENKGIIRMIQCVPKKERKTFKLMERQRMATLEKQNNNVIMPILEKKEESEAPLRRPKGLPKAISRNSSMTKDTSFSQLDTSLESYFTKSFSIDGRATEQKENIRGSKNTSLTEQSFARDSNIDMEKPTVLKNESAANIEKQANSSFSSIVSKHSKVEDKASESLEKSFSKKQNDYSAQANNSCSSAVYENRPIVSSSDESSSDSDSSDSNSDSSSEGQPRTFMLPRMPKIAYKPCVGRGLKLLFNNNGPNGNHDTSFQKKTDKSNTSVDYVKEYGYED